jgi:dienelactone hydrolase
MSAAAAIVMLMVAQPKTVDIPSGRLHLKGWLWMPPGRGPFPAVLFNHGSGTDAQHTAGLPMADAAAKLAPVFLAHGYAFLYPCRRGHGASEGLFAKDPPAHLDDVLASLRFLRTVRGVDGRRVAVAGHSFGGQLAILAGERDPSLRAAVTFGAAAASWDASAEIRERLLAAVRKSSVPLMLTHFANDYSSAPGRALDAELERLHRPHLLKMYPAFGRTLDDGHNAVYYDIPQWETDVFDFLARHLARR